MRLRKTEKSYITLPPSEYPEGTFLKTEKGYYYVFSKTVRYRFGSKRVLDSWSPSRIVETSEINPVVSKMVVFAKMKFRNGSLLYSQADGKMYLVSDKKLRHIKNPDWLVHLNFKRSDAVWVSESEINLHEKGEPLT